MRKKFELGGLTKAQKTLPKNFKILFLKRKRNLRKKNL
jgi:hypothetical protein